MIKDSLEALDDRLDESFLTKFLIEQQFFKQFSLEFDQRNLLKIPSTNIKSDFRTIFEELSFEPETEKEEIEYASRVNLNDQVNRKLVKNYLLSYL